MRVLARFKSFPLVCGASHVECVFHSSFLSHVGGSLVGLKRGLLTTFFPVPVFLVLGFLLLGFLLFWPPLPASKTKEGPK